MSRRLPSNWRKRSFPALWEWLNDPRQHPTPQVTIEAVLWCVQGRGLSALKEPANRARLKRCDRTARAEINRRIGIMIEKGIIRYEPTTW
jgi:hypothetical protein